MTFRLSVAVKKLLSVQFVHIFETDRSIHWIRSNVHIFNT